MKYKILIVPDKQKDSDDARLRCRIRWNGNITALSVGYRVVLAKWSQDAQRCKANSIHGQYTSQKINLEIDRLIKNVSSAFDHFDNIDQVPTIEEFKAYYDETFNQDKKKKLAKPLTISEAIYEFIKHQGTQRNWQNDVYIKFYSLQRHFEGYNNINIKDVDCTYLDGFIRYLAEIAEMRNTTMSRLVDNVRWFLRWCAERNMINSDDWRTWHPRFKNAQKKVIFLDWDELMKLYECELKHPYQQQVRDVFCFQCFTGLRYSDVARLTKANIKTDRISFTSKKDSESIEISLNKYAKSILDKYNDFDEVKVLPVISNQKYNDYIKEVCQIAKIDELINITYYVGNERHDETFKKYEKVTTHCARRTFICNALALGIPVNVIMSWTGHADYKSMKPYIDVAEKTRQIEMDKFNQK